MRFGIATRFLWEHTVAAALEIIAANGYAAAEIWTEHLWKTGETPEVVRQTASDLGLELSLHAASYDVNITSLNEGIRRESRRQMETSIRLAGQLGAQTVVVHPGRMSSSKDAAEDFWPSLMEAVEAMDALAGKAGVTIGLEAMERRPLQFFVYPEDVRRMFGQSWRHIGLTLDLAHASTLGDPLEFLAQIDPDWVVHVHCSDSSPTVTHLPLGQGVLDIAGILDRLGEHYRGLAIIEGYVPGRGETTIAGNMAYLWGIGFGG